MRNINLLLIFLGFYLFCTVTNFSLTDSKQYDAGIYQSALESVQKQFEDKVKEVQVEIDGIIQVLANTTITSQVIVSQVEEGVADQRNSLYQMQQILKIPFQLRECQCANLTQTQHSQISQKIQNISTKIINLRSSLKTCNYTSCPRYEELAFQLSQSQNYLNIMNKTINAQCCKGNYQFLPENATGLVNLQGTIYKDNLNAQNWFYGNITEKDYTLQRFQYSTKFNLTSCPLETPYADLTQNVCFSCPYVYQYFNLGTRSCVSCDKFNSYLNLTNGVCQFCPNNTLYNSSSQVCQFCNISAGKYINTTTLACQSCHYGQFFSSTNNICVSCPGNAYFDTNQSKCISCPNQTYWMLINSSCIGCPSGGVFNVQTQLCIICPNGTYYNQSASMCYVLSANGSIPCPSDSPYYNQYSNMCEKCYYYEIYDLATNSCIKNTNISVCPPDRPFYNPNTLNCIACPTGSQYDINNKVCLSFNCKQNQLLNPFTNQCQNSANVCGQGLFYNPTIKTCVTSQKTNSTDCLFNQYYNEISGECNPISSTCTSDQYYDPSTAKCVPLSQINSSQTNNSQSNNSQSNTSTTCSLDQSYDPSTGRCIPTSQTCSSSQYYDLTSYSCKNNSDKCQVDYTYIPGSGLCISSDSFCTMNQYYSTSSHSCLSASGICYPGQFFNKSSNSCLPISNLCAQNGTVQDLESGLCVPACPNGYFYNRSSSVCQTNQNSTILQCNYDQIYIFEVQLCLKTSTTCTDWQWYNTNTYKCQNSFLITSPYAANLVMQSQPFTAYQTYYTSLVNQYASIQNCLKVCPSANPYYDQNNKICINCPNGSPLFDLETFRCANCGTGFIFDPSNHQCILNNS